eukprot:CAMPEP_0168365630 /NCGR_PEP_ID=MMETSP0228-20121227/4816_1 /TAXON_ID=133427 /ORGANISM="Protoceratium reticulatum, Strain CCCM 535 (=CCMP 1889)" /LENGTH=733 /DNA_ID=CAMNT_0008378415 /DNA_START=13 /DNA_END=2214 /DNA_ORIENTATION=+
MAQASGVGVGAELLCAGSEAPATVPDKVPFRELLQSIAVRYNELDATRAFLAEKVCALSAENLLLRRVCPEPSQEAVPPPLAGTLLTTSFADPAPGGAPRGSMQGIGQVVLLPTEGGHAKDSDELIFEMRAVWKEGSAAFKRADISRISAQCGVSYETSRVGDEIHGKCPLQGLVAKPNSRRSVTWDVACFVVLGWDVLFLPLQAFDMPQEGLILVVEVLTASFWMLDIVSTFFTGYHKESLVEMRMSEIAKRYAGSWLLFDVVIVSMDWVLVALRANFFGLGNIAKVARMARLLRLIRLIRILKVMALLANITELLHSESVLTVLGVVRITVGIVVVNHVIGCAWYAIGSWDMGESTWVKTYEAEFLFREGRKADSLTLYSTSLHWSLTQFTPASMEVVPCNVMERVFAILVIIFALVSFSSFLSSMTSAMTHLRQLNHERSRQQEYVRRYMVENKITMDLGNRIYRFLKQQQHEVKSRIHEDDIVSLKMMPTTLQVQLHTQVYMPILISHPGFWSCHHVDESCSERVCHTAMSEHSLQAGQELFTRGTKGEKMYFVRSGCFDYYLRGPHSGPCTLSDGDYMCEMVLWVLWEHRGRLTATTTCEVVALDPTRFAENVREAATFLQWKRYAKLYTERLFAHTLAMKADEPLSDLWDSNLDLSEIAHAAFSITRSTVSRRRQPTWATRFQEALRVSTKPQQVSGCSSTIAGDNRFERPSEMLSSTSTASQYYSV